MNVAALLVVVVWVVAAVGWVWNIIKLVGMDFAGAVTVELVLRAVGVVFVPLGSIMGFL